MESNGANVGLRLVLLGAPGAGKGTQGKRLSKAYRVPHIATGDIFRRIMEYDTDIGREVGECLEQGQLVSDELAYKLVVGRMQEPDTENGYILDGFPRSLPQAELWQEYAEDINRPVDAVISIEVADEEIVTRIVARRQCATCGAIYNLKFDPPPDPQRCPKQDCNGELVRRDDDNEETIRERLRVYHETTEPIRAYYDELGLLQRLPADNLPPDAVYKKIEELLNALGVASGGGTG